MQLYVEARVHFWDYGEFEIIHLITITFSIYLLL